MLRHKNILVLIDGSPAGLNALGQVLAASAEGTKVSALAVVPPYDGDLRLVGVSRIEKIMREPCIKALAKAQELASAHGRRIETVCDEGELHERVADAALAGGFDLIAAGLGEAVLGDASLSASQLARIIGYSPCDVLALPTGAAINGNILLAYDGSRFSMAAVERAMELAASPGATLTAVKVIDVPLPVSALGVGAANKLYAKARATLHEVRDVCEQAGIAAEYLVESGEPAQTITQTAGRKGAGLIVMGWLGKTGLRRLLLGSVVEKVLAARTHCVLIAKT
jgi:nucleotide-binding universal stress UspA family protein